MAFLRHSSDTKYRGLGEEEEAEICIEIEPDAAAAIVVEVFDQDAEGAVGPMEDEIQEGDADREARDDQLGQEEAEGAKAAEAAPKTRRNRPRIQYKFLPWQVLELEKVFEKTQYPDVFKRRELSRRVFLAETKLQTWFKTRRAKHRKMLRERTDTETLPSTEDQLNHEMLQLP